MLARVLLERFMLLPPIPLLLPTHTLLHQRYREVLVGLDRCRGLRVGLAQRRVKLCCVRHPVPQVLERHVHDALVRIQLSPPRVLVLDLLVLWIPQVPLLRSVVQRMPDLMHVVVMDLHRGSAVVA